mmetsp:Transcript_34765/g.98542  ORF Transcript_34765/g.98542 Transcript_34765/m.98542 type:complete len:167 (-) Transcript_34765:159-659(-)|eukprot:CAMPEP_0117685156 /NCGR_PEP_ID=MMETSP0804-20121206/21566_1 /TAXON_ID=1074897 /ORGANISM="Tetraselmis astigmatica, Strain CCMP880" /LENGTH=166 /DNA_ID=CAMNT_0005496363 /DNA_START=202 /DNA_END=702 /DNA_ORIENTATION=+
MAFQSPASGRFSTVGQISMPTTRLAAGWQASGSPWQLRQRQNSGCVGQDTQLRVGSRLGSPPPSSFQANGVESRERGVAQVLTAWNQPAPQQEEEDLVWWEDEVDDWSSPGSAASNLLILLLAFTVATSVFGTILKLLFTCFFILISGFKYAAVCIFLVLFAAFLA